MSTVRTANGRFRKTQLRNGLRVITETLPAVRSVSLGVWIDVGSRNESPEVNGVSHLIEHMVFKGTRKRNVREIASSLEALGGSLNGWTSREHTCYTARVLDQYLPDAVDVLADISCNPRMTPTNLAREKLVICEEIKESIDTPSDKIHDLFAETFWGQHPLGYPIMGTQNTILGMSRRKMMNYYRRNYQTGNVVIAASGSVSHDRLVRLCREKFIFPEGRGTETRPAVRGARGQVKVVRDRGTQTHFCLGFDGISYGDRDRMSVLALSTHLGGGMSSVLFQKIREERGLAYSVFTFHDFYRDSGVFGAYMASDGKSVPGACELMLKEMRKLKRRRISEARLDQIKSQIKGQIMLGLESTYNRMSRIARLELMYGQFVSLDDTLKAIDAVTTSTIMEQANRVLDEETMAIAVLGPVGKGILSDVV